MHRVWYWYQLGYTDLSRGRLETFFWRQSLHALIFRLLGDPIEEGVGGLFSWLLVFLNFEDVCVILSE